MQHLISIQPLSADNIHTILENAQKILAKKEHLKNAHPLENQFVANLFFEPSTRTRISFEVAAKRVGAEVINFDTSSSSLAKGETLLDTINNLEAMGINYFVIRHQEENIFTDIMPHILPTTKIINAGNGCHSHPTQALLDMLTIQQHKKNFHDLNIAIIGDIKHSRVAHSDIDALKKLNAKEIRLIGPDDFLEDITGTKKFNNINEGLADADVIMLLRIQKERMENSKIPDAKQYLKTYGLTKDRLSLMKNNAIIMHPGPINWNVEIADDVITDQRAVILQQVSNGIAIRMAILLSLHHK